MPKNTPAPFVIGISAILLGFGLTWYIWWMAILGLVISVITLIVRFSHDDIYYYIPAEHVQKIESEHLERTIKRRTDE